MFSHAYFPIKEERSFSSEELFPCRMPAEHHPMYCLNEIMEIYLLSLLGKPPWTARVVLRTAVPDISWKAFKNVENPKLLKLRVVE